MIAFKSLVPSRIRPHYLATGLLSLSAIALIGGCSDSLAAKDPGQKPTLFGKADAAERLTPGGPLGFGADLAATGVFSKHNETFGHVLKVSGPATIALEITHKGTTKQLDTYLTVVGPLDANGGWPSPELGADDDSGYGQHSKLVGLALPTAGSYLVTVTTWGGTGRGKYRLEATCAGAGCVAPSASVGCRPEVAAAITACHEGWLADDDTDLSLTNSEDLLRSCADPEIVAPVWDELCTTGSDRPAFCGADLADFTQHHLRLCEAELVGAFLDSACIFGTHYRDMFTRPGPLVIQWQRVLQAEDSAQLSAIEKKQILTAVRQTAYDDVTSLAEAFAAVDDGIVNQISIFDASGRRSFMAYEVGAGDNSFGAWFPADSATPVAVNQDGDIDACTVGWGKERRLCLDAEPCADGLSCQGRAGGEGPGRCLDQGAPPVRGDGASCTTDSACSSGLVCAGASAGGGLCNPAWMRGSFFSEPNIAIGDAPAPGATAVLEVFGLATVSTDVFVAVFITHPRVSDLRVILTNPDGTEGVVFEGQETGSELYLRHQAVQGFPGDESVNGTWTLTATDTVSGVTGQFVEFGLELTSRWD